MDVFSQAAQAIRQVDLLIIGGLFLLFILQASLSKLFFGNKSGRYQ